MGGSRSQPVRVPEAGAPEARKKRPRLKSQGAFGSPPPELPTYYKAYSRRATPACKVTKVTSSASGGFR
jgi:hypothetical protein